MAIRHSDTRLEKIIRKVKLADDDSTRGKEIGSWAEGNSTTSFYCISFIVLERKECEFLPKPVVVHV
jgi:hypothetical protein